MHFHIINLSHQEMLDEGPLNATFYVDEGVVDFTATGNEVSGPSFMSLNDHAASRQEGLNPRTTLICANDRELYDHNDHPGNHIEDLTLDQTTYFLDTMVRDDQYHHTTEEVQISEGNQNDDVYRYIIDALQASEEYIINESSF